MQKARIPRDAPTPTPCRPEFSRGLLLFPGADCEVEAGLGQPRSAPDLVNPSADLVKSVEKLVNSSAKLTKAVAE